MRPRDDTIPAAPPAGLRPTVFRPDATRTTLRLPFRWVHEEHPGAEWLALFARAWPSYRNWFLKEGLAARPSLAQCRRQLRAHMPDLVPVWQHLVQLAGGADDVARMLSLYRPTPFLAGCSQAVWTRGSPMLVRNYDFHPHACEGTFLFSRWNGVRVLASSDCLWGALDGMNEHGLAVALAFGGSRRTGDGFGIPLVLRHLLETCASVDQASHALLRTPAHMAYNVSLLDATGAHAVAHLSPGRATTVHPAAVATNHQVRVEWPAYERLTRSIERRRHLEAHLDRPGETPAGFARRFLEPPLHARQYRRAFGTLYTVAYHPRELRAEYLWPNGGVTRSFADFQPGMLDVVFEA